MILLSISKIFFNAWFWLTFVAIIIAIHYFWGKTPPPPKPNKFFTKHKKTITKITDIFLVCTVLFLCLILIFPVSQVFRALSEPQPIKAIDLHFAWVIFFTYMIIISGQTGVLIGFLSVFHSNLTKVKRVFLTIISLLPILFTVLLLLTGPVGEPGYPWSVVKFGVVSLISCWFFNGPAIIVGKHFLQVAWTVMRSLRLVSGDYTE